MERLTPEYLESQIHSEHYVRPEGCGTLTICVLTMKNGLHIVGESACLNPADFDAALGEKYARQNAFSKLWQLEGYARASAATGSEPRVTPRIYINVEQLREASRADALREDAKATGLITDAQIGKILDLPESHVARERARLEKLFGDIRVGGTD